MVYTLNVSASLGPDYVAAVNDIVRMVVIQVFTHVMMSVADPGTCLLSGDFWICLGYLLVGTSFYHLVVVRALPVT